MFEGRVLDKERYRQLINDWVQTNCSISRIQEGLSDIPRDEKWETKEILKLNLKRHSIHLQLFEAGLKLEKTKADVLFDIRLREGGLYQEYGLKIPILSLPQDGFSASCNVYDSNNLFVGGYSARQRFNEYDMREDRDVGWIEEVKKHGPYLDCKVAHEETVAKGKAVREKEIPSINVINRWNEYNYLMFIYAMEWGTDAYDYVPAYSEYYELRKKYLAEAAKELGLNILILSAGGYHGQTAWYGLEVRTEDLEKTALKIHANRGKYWLTHDKEEKIEDKDKTFWLGAKKQIDGYSYL